MSEEYPVCCKVCFNNGLYTCKRILDKNKCCMFFTTEENKLFEFLKNNSKR